MSDSRYARLEQISWWDRDRVKQGRALVAGAGALGNELIKNLLLIGWGTIVVADADRIEESNLSRSVLFRAGDVGQPKAAVVARNSAVVNPDSTVIALDGDVRLTVSSGLLARMDVAFGCLDNVAARVAVGQLAGQAGCLMVDGGLNTWEGTVRLFRPPDGPCYACGLSEDDLHDLILRRSCVAYAARSQQAGGVPTTPTVASMTGALMAQQGLKWIHAGLHDQDIPVGRELRLDLAHDRFWNVTMPRNESCVLHPQPMPVAETPVISWEQSWASVRKAVRADFAGQDAELHLPLQILTSWECRNCGAESDVPRAHVGDIPVMCTQCGRDAVPDLTSVILGGEPWEMYSPREMGFPPWTRFEARSGDDAQVYEVGGAPPELADLASGWRP